MRVSSLPSRSGLPVEPRKERGPSPTTGHDRPASQCDPVLVTTHALRGNSVYDIAGRFLGEIEELVVDLRSGRVAYAIMLAAAFLGMDRKMFALPWNILSVDALYQRCVINVDLERLIDAPLPDGDLLPRMADPGWATQVHAYFGCEPYWK